MAPAAPTRRTFRKRGRPPKIEYRFRKPIFYSKVLKRSWGPVGQYDDPTVHVHALHKGEIIGVFQFYMERHKDGRALLVANGTCVAKPFRGYGIAKELWKRAFKYGKPTAIDVRTVSAGGESLIKSLIELYPKLDWMDQV